MTRVRTDNVFGTTTDAPLTAGATTLNSAGLANLAAVSSAEAIIILDPNRVSGAPEIVVVTAHTGSATSATITRGQFGTSAREHAAGTEWVHGPIASNATSYATAADDQGDYVPMNAWEAYTPSNTAVTVGNGTQTARFMRVGRTVFVMYKLAFGSTTAFTGSVSIGLPVNGSSSMPAEVALGAAQMVESGVAFRPGVVSTDASPATDVRILHDEEGSNTGVVNATSPFTWGTGDILSFTAVYEAAS